MKHVSTTALLLNYARRGALLLALGAAGPAALGQSFGPATVYSTGTDSQPYGLALGDVDNDGRLDIVSANSGTNTVGTLLARVGGFTPVSTYPTSAGSTPMGIAVGDVNGDGRLDLVTANRDARNVGVLMGQSGGGFAPVSTYSTGAVSAPISVALSDVNGDGRPDIVTANYGNDTAGVLLGLASGGFAPVSLYTTGTGSGPVAVAVGDVNNDGRLDIVTANYVVSSVSVLLGMASGFAPVISYSTGPFSEPQAVALSDVNRDGRLDIITANFSATFGISYVGVLLGQAGGGFAPVVHYEVGTAGTPVGVVVGDVNGDSRLDIVTANYGNGTVGVLLGQASGFAPVVTYLLTGTFGSPYGIKLGDMNGDNRPDIVISNAYDGVGVLLNTGTFTPLATARPTAADFALYPNPAHEAFTVQLPAGVSPGSAELLNALGQVVRRPAVGAASFRVETSGLAPGVYTLRLQAGGAALARRVVVQ